MADLKDQTEDNRRKEFAAEPGHRRDLYFLPHGRRRRLQTMSPPSSARTPRGENGHAHGHIEF